MFSILQKPQDAVNAEDLETLQNEIEQRLVDVVTRKWELESDLNALNSTSNDPTASSTVPSSTNTAPGKLRNSQRIAPIDLQENSVDDLKSSSSSNNNGISSRAVSADDSNSSEDSLISSLTDSTIITTNQLLSGSQIPNSYSNPSLKRASKNNERPSKRFKPNSSSATTGNLVKRPPHSKHRSKIVTSNYRGSVDEPKINKKQYPRNEAPDKLWPFVEQFCATPTEEQMEELQEMINAIQNDKEYFKIPSLGKKEPSCKDSPSKTESSPSKSQRRSKSRCGDDDSNSLGALTQRLVSSLIEETDDSSTDAKSNSGASQAGKKKNQKSKGNKGVDLNNAKNFEKRIRQVLEEHEILDDKDEIPYASEDDEILRELAATQHELATIQNQNRESMQKLLDRARKHAKLEAEREKLKEANAEVVAAYQKLVSFKQRKKQPGQKDKDAAWKALKAHEEIFRTCDELYLGNLNRNGV